MPGSSWKLLLRFNPCSGTAYPNFRQFSDITQKTVSAYQVEVLLATCLVRRSFSSVMRWIRPCIPLRRTSLAKLLR